VRTPTRRTSNLGQGPVHETAVGFVIHMNLRSRTTPRGPRPAWPYSHDAAISGQPVFSHAPEQVPVTAHGTTTAAKIRLIRSDSQNSGQQEGANWPRPPLGGRCPGDLRSPYFLPGRLRDRTVGQNSSRPIATADRQSAAVRLQAAVPTNSAAALPRAVHSRGRPAGPGTVGGRSAGGEEGSCGPGILPGWPETVLITMRRLARLALAALVETF